MTKAIKAAAKNLAGSSGGDQHLVQMNILFSQVWTGQDHLLQSQLNHLATSLMGSSLALDLVLLPLFGIWSFLM